MKTTLFYTFLLLLVLFNGACTKKVFHFADQNVSYKRFDGKTFEIDTVLDKMIQPYRKNLTATMNEVIGEFKSEMNKAKPSSSLTNFVCDAILESYEDAQKQKIDLVIQNFGGIRVNSIGSGPILTGEIYELMPFENYLVVMNINGKDLKTMLDKIAKSTGWPISKGSGFTIKDSSAVDIVINNEPFDENKNYVIATSDYVANGGDDMKFLSKTPKQETGMLIRYLIIAYIKKNKIIEANNEKRIKVFNK